METKEKTKITDTILNGLKKAAIEMEELRVQVALGKAEAKDLYEENKKKFNNIIHEAKNDLNAFKNKTASEVLTLRVFLETLQVQLALGKAETKEAFEEQRKKISKALNELEGLIKTNETTSEYYTKLLGEVEKFKIKLEIIKLRYELKKLGAGEEFEERKADFLNKLKSFKTNIFAKTEKQKDKVMHFQDEIKEAYGHLKKAFVN